MEGKDNKIESNNFINVSGNLLDLSTKRIMGIVNVNDDSFYEDSRANSLKKVMELVEKHVDEGVDILDVGAISTRPNADLKQTQLELDRLIPALKEIRRQFPELLISVDTFRTEVAEIAIDEGVSMVNDVYGGRFDGEMFEMIGRKQVPYILMHSRGFSNDMMEMDTYESIVNDVIYELSGALNELREKGVKDVIVDPGFGFAKNMKQNYELLKGIDRLSALECPVLAGLSRKSMVYKKLDVKPEEALNGTTVLNTLAVLKGVNILRVHDVREAKEILTLLEN